MDLLGLERLPCGSLAETLPGLLFPGIGVINEHIGKVQQVIPAHSAAKENPAQADICEDIQFTFPRAGRERTNVTGYRYGELTRSRMKRATALPGSSFNVTR